MNEWIKIEDELPIDGQYVLFCSVNRYGVDVHTSFGAFCKSKENGNLFISLIPYVENITNIYCNITHWMRLPNPPKNED